jgi:hypothetical protein
MVEDAKIIIITKPHCHRCKGQIFLIENIFDYEVVEMNNSKHFIVLNDRYGIKSEDELPTFILMFKNKELFRSHEPIDPKWASHLIKVIKEKDIV